MALRTVGIAGAGLLGRLLAWSLARRGLQVSVFDPAGGPAPRFDGHGAAAFTAAGMLSPLAEREVASERVSAMGWRSIEGWQAVAAAIVDPSVSLEGRPGLRVNVRGSLLLAHRSDRGTAERLLSRLPGKLPAARRPTPLAAGELVQLEPALHGVPHAWLLPGEGLVDPVATMQALHDDAGGVQWHWGHRVEALRPGALCLSRDGVWRPFDLVVDARGLGARPVLPVRGVRGETVWLRLPGHGLRRPVRLLHPRHRVYLVPRSDDLVVVGASEIETEDRSPVSLRSAVELMAAAASVMPVLQEARIERLDRNLRPALPDHEPLLHSEAGLLRMNGLFRHGWLLAPALVEDALAAQGLGPLVPEAPIASTRVAVTSMLDTSPVTP